MNRYLANRKVLLALTGVTSDVYWNWYRDRKADQTLILDNGAYEGRLDTVKFEDLINYVNPQVVVLPDLYLGNWERNLHLGLGYLDITRATFCEFMFVPQAEPSDMSGFLNGLTVALKDKRISWVALPRCLATDIARNTLARCFMAEFIRKEYPHVKIHALGMVDGNPYELAMLAERGVYSCDSSAPVWRGWNGLTLHNHWDGPDIDFNAVIPAASCSDLFLKRVNDNLEEVDRACRYGIRIGQRTTVQAATGEDSEGGGTQPHFS